MLSSKIAIFKELQSFLEESAISTTAYRTVKNGFTKTKRLTFTNLVLFLINLPRKSLSIELEDFYTSIGQPELEVSKSCLSQGRKKLCPSFFKDWNDQLISLTGKEQTGLKTWQGHRLYAVDGSTLILPESKKVRAHFGTAKNGHTSVAMGRFFCRYDVLNRLVIHSDLGNMGQSEKSMAIERLEEVPADVINIYDRGYMSFELAFLHLYYQKKFVIRCKLSFNKKVKAFVQSSETSKVVKIKSTYKGLNQLRKQGFTKKQVSTSSYIKVRLVKVILDNGEMEILCTSLLNQQKHPTSRFKELYGYRWGVETYYDQFKNYFQAAIFSGITVIAILQDFHATVFMSNIQSILMASCELEVQKINLNRTLEYQININVSIGRMKNKAIFLFLIPKNNGNYDEQNLTNIVISLKNRFLKSLEPIRKNRTVKRYKRVRNQRGRFRTLKNFKSAI